MSQDPRVASYLLQSITGGPCNLVHVGTTTCLENVALSHAVLNLASNLAVVVTLIPTIHRLVTSTKRSRLGVSWLWGRGMSLCLVFFFRFLYVRDARPQRRGSLTQTLLESKIASWWQSRELIRIPTDSNNVSTLSRFRYEKQQCRVLKQIV